MFKNVHWTGMLMMAALLSVSHGASGQAAAVMKPVTIMPVGDSITEGGDYFVSYRYGLWERLFKAGYIVEYVGTRKAPSRIGDLMHEGYSGKPIEFIATQFEKNYREHPADIVLLHGGHNHSVEEQPIPIILKSTEQIITTARRVNPKVKILLAQVITSGKLPKYSYIPELNLEIAKLAARLHTSAQPVILVNQADGFDWKTDTVKDMVHPNASGADKMAAKWADALATVLPPPAQSYAPEIITYKKTPTRELTLHVFKPQAASEKPRAAIVFFFGGGWVQGTPLQFYRDCAYLASRGMVAISADYRVATIDKTSPMESMSDGKSAIRWVRQHAVELGIDPARIAAAGASAGGQVAAATATVDALDEAQEDRSISSHPDAMLLWYPVIDNGPQGYGPQALKDRYQELSPLHAAHQKVGPTVVFQGTKDDLIPVATAEAFQKKLESLGGRCDLHLYDGGHPLYQYRKGPSELYDNILKEADRFLVSIGYLPSR